MKHFLSSSFLDAEVKNEASLGWKSICNARHIINLGSQWWINDEEFVAILG